MSNAVFPSLPGLKWDVIKAPEWLTKVHRSVGAKEQRAAFWSRPIYRWTLSYELLRASAQLELQSLIGFFNARQGMFDSFLYSDPTDNNVTAHGFGVGDGATTAFQLQRSLAGPRTLDWQGAQPVYTVPRTNYAPFSEALSSWSGAGAVTPAAATCGSAVLDLVYDAVGGETNYLIEDIGLPLVGAKGFSLLVKKGIQQAAQSQINLFDLTASALRLQAVLSFDGNGVPSVSMNFGMLLGIDACPNGCYRIRMQSVSTIAGNLHRIYLQPSRIGSAAGNTYFGAIQLEDGSPTAYIKTPGAAGVVASPAYWPATGDAFEAVLDLPGAPTIFRNDWQGNQQLYPYARKNGTLWSEQLDNAAWTKTNATITPNIANGPDGSLTGDKLAATATGGVLVFQVTDAVTAGRKCSISVDFIPETAAFVWAGDQQDAVWHRAWVNCSTMQISTLDSVDAATLTQLRNGWWRLSVSFTRTNAGNLGPTLGISDLTNSTSCTAGNWAAFRDVQSELSPFPTSYIQTVGSTATVTDYTISATGVVTFANAPLLNAALTWTGSYYWRVRFDLDQAEFNNFLTQLWEAKKITFVTAKAA